RKYCVVPHFGKISLKALFRVNDQSAENCKVWKFLGTNVIGPGNTGSFWSKCSLVKRYRVFNRRKCPNCRREKLKGKAIPICAVVSVLGKRIISWSSARFR